MYGCGGHDRRYWKHKQRSEEALQRARKDLFDCDDVDAERRENAILDFAGDGEVLNQRKGGRLDSLEHDGGAEDARHEDRREHALSVAATPDALPNLREDVGKHEDEQERLQQRPGNEFVEVLADHQHVTRQERADHSAGSRP